MKRKKIIPVLSILLSISLLAACVGTAEQTTTMPVETTTAQTETETESTESPEETTGSDTVVVGVSMANDSEVSYQHVIEGIKHEAEKFSYELDLNIANDDSAVQIEQIEELIENNVTAIIVAPVDGDALEQVIAKSNEAGILVYTVVNAAKGEVKAHIESGVKLGADQAAAYVARRILENSGTVAVVSIDDGHKEYIEWYEGVNDHFSAKEEFALISGPTDLTTVEQANDYIEQLLSENEELDAIFTLGTILENGSLDIIKDSGRDIKIISFEGGETAKAEILQEGLWIMDVERQSEAIGVLVMEYIFDILRGEIVPEYKQIAAQILDASNIE